jgi:hypothetical protein
LVKHPCYTIEIFFLAAPAVKSIACGTASKSEFRFMTQEKPDDLTFCPNEFISKLKTPREHRD